MLCILWTLDGGLTFNKWKPINKNVNLLKILYNHKLLVVVFTLNILLKEMFVSI